MDLFKQIIAKAIQSEEISINFPNLKISPEHIIEKECYKALEQIKNIIRDDTISDRECFIQIEKIVNIFEQIGCDDIARHDF